MAYGTITGYLWDFGDGVTSTSASPVHTYTSGKIFPVSCIISDSLGETATLYAVCNVGYLYTSNVMWYINGELISSGSTLTINDPVPGIKPISGVVYNQDNESGIVYGIYSVGIYNIFNYLLEYGDSYSDPVDYAIHSYNSPGSYTASGYIIAPYQETWGSGVVIEVTATEFPSNSNYKLYLTNNRVFPYKLDVDTLKVDAKLYNQNKLSYCSDIPVELWLNYEGYQQVYASGVTNKYGVVSLDYPTSGFPSINCCLGRARAYIDDQWIGSNLVRFNFR